MKPLELQLKEILGVKEYNRFADTVLFPAIEQLAESGKLSNSDLAKLAKLTKTYGAGIFDVAASDVGEATKHNLSDGFSIIAKYKLNEDLEFNLFVKKFSDKKSFDRGVLIQEEIAQHLRNTDLAGVVPEQLYKNRGKRIVVMPLVEAKSLNAVLPESKDKEELLRKTITEYLKITDHIGAKKVFVPPKRNALGKLWYDDFKLPSLQNFDRFFAKGFGADEKITESYKQHIGSRLNGNTGDFIHGDLHPGNILINDKTHFIDWELAANGFTEFDLYKLFTKSNVSDDLEDRLLAYTVMTKEKLRAKRENRQPASADTHRLLFEASKTRYRLNQITQDLLTAERYNKNAQKDVKRHDKLEKMALTAYNIALRHIEKAESEGILSADFRLTIEDFVQKNKPYNRINNVEFAQLLSVYNPHTTLSQDNLVSHGTEIGAPVDKESKQKNLEIIRKSLHKKDWGKIAKLGIAAAVLLCSASYGGRKYLESELARIKLEEKAKQEDADSWFRNDFCKIYETRIEAELHGGKIRWAYTEADKRPLGKVRLIEDRELIKNTCDKYNLDLQFTRRMYKINAAFANVENNKMSDRGINFLDPYRFVYTKGSEADHYDPVINLEFGAKRLSRLFDKYKVDRNMIKNGHHVNNGNDAIKNNDSSLQPLIRALKQFYTFQKNYTEDEEDKRYEEQLSDDKKYNKKLARGVREIIYALLTNGPQSDFNGDIVYLEQSGIPDNFMRE